MAKPLTDQSMQSERGACKPRNPGEPNAEALRLLARENQRLRAQVAALTEMLAGQAAPPSSNRDEREPDNDALRPFPGHQL